MIEILLATFATRTIRLLIVGIFPQTTGKHKIILKQNLEGIDLTIDYQEIFLTPIGNILASTGVTISGLHHLTIFQGLIDSEILTLTGFSLTEVILINIL